MYTEHKYIIYEIENQINGKKYIGQTTRGFKVRKREHINRLNNQTHDNQHLLNAWNKYGAENFTFNVLEECDYEDLGYYEQNYIFMWNLTNPNLGYNQTTGGEIGYRRTKESKQKQAKVIKELWADSNSKYHSNEFKQKKSNSSKGKNNPMYGKKLSEEAKKKKSISMKKAWNNPNSLLRSDEVSKKRSESKIKSWANPNSKHNSKESLEKMSKTKSKKQTTTGFYRVYKSKTKTKQGYSWRYQYLQNGKRFNFTSINLFELEKKVKAHGLPWEIIDKNKAQQSIEENNRLHPKGD